MGESTKEEHDEIKKYVLILSNILKITFYGILFYLSIGSNFIYLFLVLFMLYILSFIFKNEDLMKFHDIVLLGVSFLFLQNLDLSILLIFMFTIIFENSFRKFYWKEEIYSIVLYLIIYILFKLLIS